MVLALGATLFGCVGEKTDNAAPAPKADSKKPAANENKQPAAVAAVAAKPTWVVYTYDG